MLSVVIATKDSERALVATLAALVPGAADGLIRDVTIADAGSADRTVEIADGAGCRVLTLNGPIASRLKAAAAVARGPWLMFLRPGIVPDPIWIAEVSRFIELALLRDEAGRRAATFRSSLEPDSMRSVLPEALALLKAALGMSRPTRGLIIAKHFYEELGGHDADAADCDADLLRRIGRRRTTLLRCGAFNMSG